MLFECIEALAADYWEEMEEYEYAFVLAWLCPGVTQVGRWLFIMTTGLPSSSSGQETGSCQLCGRL